MLPLFKEIPLSNTIKGVFTYENDRVILTILLGEEKIKLPYFDCLNEFQKVSALLVSVPENGAQLPKFMVEFKGLDNV